MRSPQHPLPRFPPVPNLPLSSTGSALWTCLASVRAPGGEEGGRLRAGSCARGCTPGLGSPGSLPAPWICNQKRSCKCGHLSPRFIPPENDPAQHRCETHRNPCPHPQRKAPNHKPSETQENPYFPSCPKPHGMQSFVCTLNKPRGRSGAQDGC